METGLLLFLVFALPVLLGGAYIVAQYNGLIALRNHIREAWSNIDTELKRRYELIPNLVETVKGYAAHEREVLDRVTSLRESCVRSLGRPAEQAGDENRLVEAVRELLARVEAYPDLKADGHFLELQKQLVLTENRIQAARRVFNGNVRDYRNKCQMFPSSFVARFFGFEPEDYFDVHPSVREAPDARF